MCSIYATILMYVCTDCLIYERNQRQSKQIEHHISEILAVTQAPEITEFYMTRLFAISRQFQLFGV